MSQSAALKRPDEAARAEEPGSRMVHCTTVEDFYLGPARSLIGTLCRIFLDQMVLTPTELLYAARNHNKLDGAGTLLRDATERAAALQAKITGQKTYERMKELQELLTKLSLASRALEAAELPLPFKPGTFVQTVASIRAGAKPEVADTRIYRMLTEWLSPLRMWVEKLEKIVGLAQESADSPQCLVYVDALFSEMIMSDAAQDALFGRRVALEDRIDDLVDLYKGTYPGAKVPRPLPIAEQTNKLLQNLYLPETKAAIETSIVQLFATRNPLRSNEMMTELRAIHGMLNRMRGGGRIIGGRRALEFVDKRISRLVNEENVADYIRNTGSLVERVIALLEMYAVTFGPNNKRIIEGFITRYFGDEDFERRLLTGEGSPPHKLKLLTTLYRAVAAAPLPAGDKAQYVLRLNRMQANFIANSRMFAAIEKQNASSARKCGQVIAMCLDGTFIPGENLERAKGLIRHYMARPDFFDKYFEGATTPPLKRDLLEKLKAQLDQLGIPMPMRGA